MKDDTAFFRKMDFKIKWSGNEYDMKSHGITGDTTVLELQNILKDLTNVLPEHQKILGLKFKTPEDCLSTLKIRNKQKFMMMGSAQKEIEKVEAGRPDDLPEIIDDFDEGLYEEVDIKNNDIYLNKIEKRVKTYPIKIFNDPRPGAKLLVLDMQFH